MEEGSSQKLGRRCRLLIGCCFLLLKQSLDGSNEGYVANYYCIVPLTFL